MDFTDKAVKAGSSSKGDLLVTLELGGAGRVIEINSKVSKKFGAAIEAEINNVLDAFGIKDAKIQLDDQGTLAFGVRARLETVCKRALKAAGKEIPVQPPKKPAATTGAANDLYRTMFFVPGNAPSKLAKAEIYGADCVIFDLEDAVSVYEKDAARDMLVNYLSTTRPNCRVGIRVNGNKTPYHEDDVRTLVPLKPDFLRLPNSETAEDMQKLDALITECEKAAGIEIGTVKIVATIETALGVYNAYQIATGSPRVIAIGLGAEDYRTDMSMSRTEDGSEVLFARNQISLAAHAAKVRPIDYVYSNFKNTEGFTADVKLGKTLGFMGKSVIHPSQIPLVHACYDPTDAEVEHAKKVLAAYDAAMANASGVVALDGKMIDMPIVTRAKNTLAYAKAAGKIN